MAGLLSSVPGGTVKHAQIWVMTRAHARSYCLSPLRGSTRMFTNFWLPRPSAPRLLKFGPVICYLFTASPRHVGNDNSEPMHSPVHVRARQPASAKPGAGSDVARGRVLFASRGVGWY
jgi:hypothetical protein